MDLLRRKLMQWPLDNGAPLFVRLYFLIQPLPRSYQIILTNLPFIKERFFFYNLLTLCQVINTSFQEKGRRTIDIYGQINYKPDQAGMLVLVYNSKTTASKLKKNLLQGIFTCGYGCLRACSRGGGGGKGGCNRSWGW